MKIKLQRVQMTIGHANKNFDLLKKIEHVMHMEEVRLRPDLKAAEGIEF